MTPPTGNGPSRGEHKLRLAISLGGLALLAVAIATQGIANVAALVEVLGIAGLFFGGSAAFSAWRLWTWRSDGTAQGLSGALPPDVSSQTSRPSITTDDSGPP